jgi:hypothetical protein
MILVSIGLVVVSTEGIQGTPLGIFSRFFIIWLSEKIIQPSTYGISSFWHGSVFKQRVKQ